MLDAQGEMFVEPKFKFGVDAFVDVSADLWLTTIELYHQKWSLAAFEYGSNLRFGADVPDPLRVAASRSSSRSTRSSGPTRRSTRATCSAG